MPLLRDSDERSTARRGVSSVRLARTSVGMFGASARLRLSGMMLLTCSGWRARRASMLG